MKGVRGGAGDLVVELRQLTWLSWIVGASAVAREPAAAAAVGFAGAVSAVA